MKPYLGSGVNGGLSGSGNVFSFPSNPIKHELDDTYVEYGLGTNYPTVAWSLTPNASDPDKYYYYCSYGLNSHLADEENPAKQSSYLASWQAPATSFVLLEANQSDMSGDGLIDDFDAASQKWTGYQISHFDDSNTLYLDGHVKWRKAVVQLLVPSDDNSIWKFPPGTADDSELNDCGPWTWPNRTMPVVASKRILTESKGACTLCSLLYDRPCDFPNFISYSLPF